MRIESFGLILDEYEQNPPARTVLGAAQESIPSSLMKAGPAEGLTLSHWRGCLSDAIRVACQGGGSEGFEPGKGGIESSAASSYPVTLDSRLACSALASP